MQQIEICGKRGLGDLISGISRLLYIFEHPLCLNFNAIPGHDYDNTIKSLMQEFAPEVHYNVSFNWHTIDLKKAFLKFGKENHNQTWFFTNCYDHLYKPFKTQWLGDHTGPIALALNNENTVTRYPYPGKWFNNKVNSLLKDLIDEKNYLHLGRPYSIEENIAKLARCRYALGVDGAWVHACNAMRVPYVLVRNDLDFKIIKALHSRHPNLNVIETQEIFNFI